MKYTKNKLTRDLIKAELKSYTKGSARITTVFFLTIVITGALPFILLGIAAMSDSLISGITCIVIGVFLILIFTWILLTDIKHKRLVENGKFYIIKDSVSRLSRGEPQGKYRTVDVLYFVRFGRYVPSKTTFDLSSVGDEFYLVIIPTKKPTICFAYHTMMYECNDVDDVSM